MLSYEGNLQSLTGGLQLKIRIQHPGVHERTDRGGTYWFFRYWEDVLCEDGATKAIRKFRAVFALVLSLQFQARYRTHRKRARKLHPQALRAW